MSDRQWNRATGACFIAGAVLVNVPYGMLIANFDYPDVLRLPVGEILTKFHEGGSSLIFTWLAFAWVGLPLLAGVVMLKRILSDAGQPLTELAATCGVIGLVTQIAGLCRWVFVVPGLAKAYVGANGDTATQQATSLVFMAVHQYGGVVLGEHLGQIFMIAWMILTSVILLRADRFPRWLGWTGLATSAIYVLAQGELLATAIDDFPYWADAGLIGSLAWLAWMIALGIVLMRLPANEQHPDNA